MNKIICGDVLSKLNEIPDCSVDCCVTSPPYWGLRDYGADGQIGLEETPDLYVEKMVQVCRLTPYCVRDIRTNICVSIIRNITTQTQRGRKRGETKE